MKAHCSKLERLIVIALLGLSPLSLFGGVAQPAGSSFPPHEAAQLVPVRVRIDPSITAEMDFKDSLTQAGTHLDTYFMHLTNL